MEIENKKKFLVILGNGFDLSCEIKSGFKDFFCNLNGFNDFSCKFDELKKEMDNLGQIEDLNLIKDKIVEDDFSFTIDNVNDKFVEQAEMTGKVGGKVLPQRYVDGFLYYIASISKLVGTLGKDSIWNVLFSIYFNGNVDKNWFDVEAALNQILSELGSDSLDYYSKLSFKFLNCSCDYDSLLKELQKFENEFMSYLKRQIEKKSYHSDARDKLQQILSLRDLNSSVKNISILSFNYTNPFDYYSDDPSFYFGDSSYKNMHFDIRNIHGSLKLKKIIIGIDSNNIKPDDNRFKFTKTYRIMSITDPNNFGTLPEKIKKIVFYGHSLSEADYSYFQSIFDYYDIYNNNIQLIFGYNVYAKGKKEEILREQYNRVATMLNIYGDSFNNEKGKNLMHKLLLEGRILFKEVKGSSKISQGI